MHKWLIVFFIAVPVCELAVLIMVGSEIGVLNTILLVLFTAIAGVSLARWQGLQVFFKIQDSLRRGIFPSSEMLDGVMILCAAAVLLTPGLITDTMAFLFLIPTTRARIKAFIMQRIQQNFRDRGIVTIESRDYTREE